MIKNYLTGKTQLWVVFWLYGVLAFFIFFGIAIFIEYKYVSILMSPTLMYIAYALLILPYIYFPIAFVAIWLSASKYQGHKVWAWLAKIAVILALLLYLLSLYAIYQTAYNRPVNVQIQEEITVVNRSLPVMVDKETQFTSVTQNGDVLIYHYKLVNKDQNDFDKEKFSTYMQKQLEPMICKNPQVNRIFNAGYNINFDYVDKNDKPVTNLIFKKSDCVVTK